LTMPLSHLLELVFAARKVHGRLCACACCSIAASAPDTTQRMDTVAEPC
jgi:hypothetical protein